MSSSIKALLLAAAIPIACSTANAGRKPYADHYLADPNTSEEIKAAIQQGVVVLGMCPLQAFAAAGPPGPYSVRRDLTRWPPNSDPVKVVTSQCAEPDGSVIELAFRNTSQFGSQDPVDFRVRFVEGRAVLIDLNELGSE